MSKLFKAVDIASRRSSLIMVRLTTAEKAAIEEQALIRNLSTVEYIRRGALHRRADIKIETQMILEVRSVATAIKRLHAVYVETGSPPPKEELGAVLFAAIEAITNLARY